MPDKNATCGTSNGRYSSHNAHAGRPPSRCSRSSAASVSNVAITVATHAINSVVIIGPDSEGAARSQLSRLTPSGHAARSEERRVGKECVRTGRSRGAPDNEKKQKKEHK